MPDAKPSIPASKTKPPNLVLCACVVIASAVLLLPGAASRSVGFSLLDPVGGIVSQDEAVYSHSALQMARGGDWLTPHFMDRPATYKPPLLYWLSGLSLQMFGVDPVALRLPAIVAATGGALLVFLWLNRVATPGVAAAGALLLISSPQWRLLGQLNLMDAPLAALTLAAWAAIRLRGAKIVAGVAIGLAILMKGVAGLLPAIALTLLMGPRVWPVLAVATSVAAPWFLYQLIANFDWFWHEFVLTELLRWGLNSPLQTSAEPAWLFYARRIWATDPALWLLGLTGLWFARKDRLLLIGAGVLGCAIAAFSYHNITYLAPLLPLLAISAGVMLHRPWGIAAMLLVTAARLLPDPPNSTPKEAPAIVRSLHSYCQEGRAGDLILVGTDDQFHSTLLPLARVRYAFPDSGQTADPSPLNLKGRGIIVSVEEFLRRPAAPPPHATVIAYRSAEDLARLKREYPADYFENGALTRSAQSGSPDPSRRPAPGSCESLP